MTCQERGRALLDAIRQTTDEALATGALQPIATSCEIIEDEGVEFVVRLAEALADKPTNFDSDGPDAEVTQVDPFADPDPELTVCALSDTHLCVLNKFPVCTHHALIVTREYEEQTDPLTLADFEALAAGLEALDGIGFYNAGPLAGASQRHKHLQIVPLPLDPRGTPVPIEGALGARSARPSRSPLLPFPHRVVGIEPPRREHAEPLLAAYQSMLAELERDGCDPCDPCAHNLLITRSAMWVVPRTREHCENIEVNSLGFAGALFARSPEQMAHIRRLGPMQVLRHVTRG